MIGGVLTLLSLSSTSQADPYHIVYSFGPGATAGDTPNGDLAISGSTIFGTMQAGGATGNGTLYSLNVNGSGFAVQHAFGSAGDGVLPSAGLTLSGSNLYGTTRYGGSQGAGTVYSLNTTGGGYHIVGSLDFSQTGEYPYGTVAVSNSTIYGTTYGNTYYDGNYFPGSRGEGTVFSMNTDGSNPHALHIFDGINDGAHPSAGVTLAGSTLYAASGGNGERDAGPGLYGAVVTVTTGGDSSRLHGFTNNVSSGVIQGINDGAYPSRLTVVGDAFGDDFFVSNVLGTTPNLYQGDGGTIFSLTYGGYQRLHTFTGGPDGGDPNGLTQVGDRVVGITRSGGQFNGGTAYSMNFDGGNFQILHSFGGPGDGAQPTGGLTWDGNGNVYGATLGGGMNGAGTVFVLSVPEPSSFVLAGLSLLALVAVARRRGQQFAIRL
jgi:uncharacterized repeat protein (TIGR03803 family)